jgi:hypothetical protein
MQRLLTLFLLFFCFTLSSYKESRLSIEEVIFAIRAGNAYEISKYIDETIEVALPDKAEQYSKAQAVIILNEFFNNNEVKGFEVKHKGDNNGSQFCIGTLFAKSGSYRTTVFMKWKNGRQVIKQIGFQKI